jgi:hypothetical protein
MPSPKPVTNPSKAKARAAYHKVPEKSIADDPGRYSKTPHEYGDILITPDFKGRTKLGGALQRDLVYWIERHTWGKNIGTPTKVIRPEWAKLSLTALAKLCGSDRRTVARAVADLNGRGIIEARDRSGCGPTVAKMYKLTPARWLKAPYYEAKVMEEESEIIEAEEDDQQERAEPSNGPEATVLPGKLSRPQPVAISSTDGAPDVTIRVVYRSVDLPFPVAFRAHPGRNGRLQISCRATAPQNFATYSPIVSPITVEPEELSTFHSWITDFVLNFWGKAVDQPLLKSIVSAAEGAPLAVYERIVLQKFKRSHTGRNHSTGLLIELAKDAARAHKAEAALKQAEARRRKPATLSVAELAEIEAQYAATAAPAAPRGDPCPKCKGKGSKEEWANRGGEYKARPIACTACNGTGRKVAR